MPPEVPPPSASPWLGASIPRFNLPAVWRKWDGEGGSPSCLGVGEWGPKHKMAQRSAVLPGFWMEAGRRRRARDASGKWKAVLSRSLAHSLAAQCPLPSSRIAPELRAEAHTHQPTPSAVSSSLVMGS